MTASLLLSLTALAASIFALAFQVWIIWENEWGIYSSRESQGWDWPAEYINLHGVTAEVRAKAMEEYLSERVGGN